MIHVATLSLQGKRSSNQDRVLVAPTQSKSGSIIVAVADGLGGMQDGEQAAQLAVETLRHASDELLALMGEDFGTACQSLLDLHQHANDRIRLYSQTHAQLGSVGTTLVTLIAADLRYLVVNVGDSRCYQVDSSGVRQITHDHTVADALLESGVLAASDYDSSPLRNQLTRCLGPGPQCVPDIFPQAAFGRIEGNCTFLLCSDGFYSKLLATDLMTLADSSRNLDEVLEGLASEALRRRSADNLILYFLIVRNRNSPHQVHYR
jgi:protein phosphatase